MAIEPVPFIRVTIFFNITVIVLLLLYSMIVPLQFIPTSAHLPPENVTCYATHLPGNLDNSVITDVGGFEYVLLLLDLLRWFFPFTFIAILALSLTLGSSDIAWITVVIFGLLFLEEAIKLVIRIDEYWFCSDWQICPRCSPPDYKRCSPEDTSCPHNYLYKWIFWSNVVWIPLNILYMILMGFVVYVTKTHAEKKKQAKNNFRKDFDDKKMSFEKLEQNLEKKMR